VIEHTNHRLKFTEVVEVTKLKERSNFTTMAPPKQDELSQIAKKYRVRTRGQINHRKVNNNRQKLSMQMKSCHRIQH
jgi:hypothetical protein